LDFLPHHNSFCLHSLFTGNRLLLLFQILAPAFHRFRLYSDHYPVFAGYPITPDDLQAVAPDKFYTRTDRLFPFFHSPRPVPDVVGL
jgi:hypothetical protein